jgi:hypothetical protein
VREAAYPFIDRVEDAAVAVAAKMSPNWRPRGGREPFQRRFPPVDVTQRGQATVALP